MDIIPEKGGQCSFYLQTPINQGFSNKKQVVFDTTAVVAGVCEMIGRAFMGFVLVPIFGFKAICLASPVAWFLADLFLVPAFRFCMKRLRAQLDCEKACGTAAHKTVCRVHG